MEIDLRGWTPVLVSKIKKKAKDYAKYLNTKTNSDFEYVTVKLSRNNEDSFEVYGRLREPILVKTV